MSKLFSVSQALTQLYRNTSWNPTLHHVSTQYPYCAPQFNLFFWCFKMFQYWNCNIRHIINYNSFSYNQKWINLSICKSFELYKTVFIQHVITVISFFPDMILFIYLKSNGSKTTFTTRNHTRISSCLSNLSKQYSWDKLEKLCAIPFLNAKSVSLTSLARIGATEYFSLKDTVPLLQMLFLLLR